MGGYGLIYLSGGWEQWLTFGNLGINLQASYSMVNFLTVGGTVGDLSRRTAAWSLVG
jgi:hypothetical protein